jgi:hypothetical protein
MPDPSGLLKYLERRGANASQPEEGYAKPRSGRFSDRTNCYLLLGGPSGPQDMEFRDCLPAGEGLVFFRTQEDAVGVGTIAGGFRRHGMAAHVRSEVFGGRGF